MLPFFDEGVQRSGYKDAAKSNTMYGNAALCLNTVCDALHRHYLQTVALFICLFVLCAPFQLQHHAFLYGRTHPFCQRFASSFMEFERYITAPNANSSQHCCTTQGSYKPLHEKKYIICFIGTQQMIFHDKEHISINVAGLEDLRE